MTLALHWKRPAALLTLAWASLASNAPALAHGSTKPEHGGLVLMSGETLFELAVLPDAVALYVKEDDEALPSTGLTAKLTVSHQGKKTEVMLEPAAGNRFDGKGVKIAPGAQVVVLLTKKASMAKVSATFTLR